jgi:hypothetical protein
MRNIIAISSLSLITLCYSADEITLKNVETQLLAAPVKLKFSDDNFHVEELSKEKADAGQKTVKVTAANNSESETHTIIQTRSSKGLNADGSSPNEDFSVLEGLPAEQKAALPKVIQDLKRFDAKQFSLGLDNIVSSDGNQIIPFSLRAFYSAKGGFSTLGHDKSGTTDIYGLIVIVGGTCKVAQQMSCSPAEVLMYNMTIGEVEGDKFQTIKNSMKVVVPFLAEKYKQRILDAIAAKTKPVSN